MEKCVKHGKIFFKRLIAKYNISNLKKVCFFNMDNNIVHEKIKKSTDKLKE